MTRIRPPKVSFPGIVGTAIGAATRPVHEGSRRNALAGFLVRHETARQGHAVRVALLARTRSLVPAADDPSVHRPDGP